MVSDFFYLQNQWLHYFEVIFFDNFYLMCFISIIVLFTKWKFLIENKSRCEGRKLISFENLTEATTQKLKSRFFIVLELLFSFWLPSSVIIDSSFLMKVRNCFFELIPSLKSILSGIFKHWFSLFSLF